MKIKVQLTSKNEAYVIKNLYPLYLYDLSEHYVRFPNIHGVYEDSDEYKTLNDQYEVQNIWWEKPDCLYPYLILVEDKPAGFILIATPPHCSEGIDYFVNDFFLLRPYRGQGIAEQAAIKVFEQFKGRWELFTNSSERNITGQRFWRKTVSNYSKENYAELYGDTFDGHKLIFRFDNTEK
ncbi:GNAT family N-acetyltransferase [Paenibacillus sp. HJL G12]|uniref:GNAT family N-acetyltransferase n=1 Tax=Paenibacillus dendrobii TaxID=2691084 RepID=A0A7X3LHM7_9BACL|nr:GNAT family N-acetyltransferase [Paenibacillus dendrobii]MWV43399.1 GNAT family N-acetyltransferase [Paenibacillus dendrobii]